jgi:hypothetical protein
MQACIVKSHPHQAGIQVPSKCSVPPPSIHKAHTQGNLLSLSTAIYRFSNYWMDVSRSVLLFGRTAKLVLEDYGPWAPPGSRLTARLATLSRLTARWAALRSNDILKNR